MRRGKRVGTEVWGGAKVWGEKGEAENE